MKTIRKITTAVLCLSLVCGALQMSGFALDSAGSSDLSQAELARIYNERNYENAYVEGQVIVGLNTDASVGPADGLFPDVDVAGMETLSSAAQGDRAVYLLTLETGTDVLDAIDLLKDDPGIAYVEPNYIASIDQTPNDPSYPSLWGMQKIEAPEAWDLETGDEAVKVGVLDTGIDYEHPDLADNVDISLGWNAYGQNDSMMDYVGHGTHVAGTIGAKGDNGTGVVGVNWNVTLVPVKIGNDQNGNSNTSALSRALDYAQSKGLDVVNISYSFFDGGHYSKTVEDAITRYDGMVVGSAGNSASNLDSYTTYDCDNLILVGNSTSGDVRSGTSSYGASSVSLFAPGSSIYSTVPGGSYSNKSGTSMAAPHVTGAVALLKAYDAGLTNAQIKTALLDNVDEVPALQNLCITGGRLNLYKALQSVTQQDTYIANLSQLRDGGVYRLKNAASGKFLDVGAYSSTDQCYQIIQNDLDIGSAGQKFQFGSMEGAYFGEVSFSMKSTSLLDHYLYTGFNVVLAAHGYMVDDIYLQWELVDVGEGKFIFLSPGGSMIYHDYYVMFVNDKGWVSCEPYTQAASQQWYIQVVSE